MQLTRRHFVVGAASAMALAGQSEAATSPPQTLRSSPGAIRLAPEQYPETGVWCYDGAVPGPTIRARQGERVARVFENGLPQASSVHWHGVRLDNAMDGVAGLTQPAVEPGEAFTYDFRAPDAGTYWYHPHDKSWEQMARGLYGALIIDEAVPPDVDADHVLLIDDWRLNQNAQIDDSFGEMRDWSHSGRIGNWITVNGRGEAQFRAAAGDRLRLRLVNVANARIFTIEARGLAGWVVALDGQPLAAPTPLSRLVLAPAQRADVIVDVVANAGERADIISLERDGGYAIASFSVSSGARAARGAAPKALPPNPVPEPGDIPGQAVDLLMEGGAMGRMSGATMNGRRMSMRELVAHGHVWAFNGVAGMPEEPLLTASRGETVRIRILNETGWPHGMHLHGHHFRQMGRSGALGPLRDTTLLAAGETAEIAFQADNPGDWLLHCHMLEHQAAGMKTWLRVTG